MSGRHMSRGGAENTRAFEDEILRSYCGRTGYLRQLIAAERPQPLVDFTSGNKGYRKETARS